MRTWFTSDTHFWHERVIGYCRRPFSSVQEMNAEMIRRWQAVVAPEDRVYHLGDFAMGHKDLGPGIVAQLPGYKILVAGNHDRSRSAMLGFGFQEVHKQLRLNLDGHELLLHHEPVPFSTYWRGADTHLCGHVHEAWSCRIFESFAGAPVRRQINVGVDVRDFRPVSLQELLSSSGVRI